MHYSHLVLSASGFRAFAFFGAIQAIRDANMHRPMRHVAGCSGGAIAAFAFCADVDPRKVAERCAASVRDEAHGIHVIGPVRLSAWSQQGIASATCIEALLRDILDETLSTRRMSLRDFAKATGRELALWTTNLTRGCGQALTMETHPDLDVVTAIMASMAIPLVYRPVDIDGELHVDGAVTEFVPTSAFPGVPTEQVLQISLPPKPAPPGPGLANLLSAVFAAALRHRAVGDGILSIDVPGPGLDASNLGAVRFDVNEDTVWSQYAVGRDTVAAWLKDRRLKKKY